MRKLVIPALLLLCVVFVCLRFVQLDADPPIVLGKYGQSVLTDPYLYTWHARQATLFPSDQQDDYERFAPLKYTAVSAAAHLVFSVGNVSRTTANIASVLLNILGILLWILALRQFISWTGTLIVGLLFVSNYVLLVYSRMPYLENGLIFFSGLTFLVHTRWGDRALGQFVSGAVIAAAALGGKLFGAILYVPLFVSYFAYQRNNLVRPVILALAGGAAGFLAYIILALKGNMSLWWQYCTDLLRLQSGVSGASDPSGIVWAFMSFGKEGGLTQLGIGAICVAASGCILWLITRDLGKLQRADLPILFSVVWLAAMFALLVFFQTRPLRFMLVGFMPAITLVVPLLSAWNERIKLAFNYRWLTALLVFVVLLYLTAQVIAFVGLTANFPYDPPDIFAYCLVSSLLLTALIVVRRRQRTPEFPLLVGRCILVATLSGVVVTNGRDILTLYSNPRYDLRTLNTEIAEIISPSAKATGSYAPALTIDNQIGGVFNPLGSLRSDSTFFEVLSPTHILTNTRDWESICTAYPDERASTTIAYPIVWSFFIPIVQRPSAVYRPTLFEQAVDLFSAGQFDSASVLLKSFRLLHPKNRLGAVGALNVLFASTDQVEIRLAAVNNLLATFPDDYAITAIAAAFYDQLGRPDLSRAYLSRLNQINPYAIPPS